MGTISKMSQKEIDQIIKSREDYKRVRKYRYITGYHGTSTEIAKKIVSSGKFELSKGKNNWLGDGIYFYKYFSDAAVWESTKTGKTQAVVHAVIKVENDEYLDLEESRVSEMIDNIAFNLLGRGVNVLEMDAEERQCCLLNYVWHVRPEIKVISACFPAYRSIPDRKTIGDFRSKRREFCVRDNTVILQKSFIDNTMI